MHHAFWHFARNKFHMRLVPALLADWSQAKYHRRSHQKFSAGPQWEPYIQSIFFTMSQWEFNRLKRSVMMERLAEFQWQAWVLRLDWGRALLAAKFPLPLLLESYHIGNARGSRVLTKKHDSCQLFVTLRGRMHHAFWHFGPNKFHMRLNAQHFWPTVIAGQIPSVIMSFSAGP